MAAIGQRPLLLEEVNSILQLVVERNRMQQSLSANRHTLQSWRNLVEIVLTACLQDLIPTEDRQLIIRDLLLDLHDKVLSEDAAAELMPVVAGSVFTLTAHLSQSVRTEQQHGVRIEGIATSGFASHHQLCAAPHPQETVGLHPLYWWRVPAVACSPLWSSALLLAGCTETR
ncbi:nuclear pore complex protein Nup205-like isoform X1 [Polyodon spathula]|uniref:nuclear pore complex protein Nup205-like isoform X1 n=1 Tax=Polyodon spathula TaxID=7913 RepID=UPI001B7DB490|nr:nuclear pore complex protein Nup205-like isoform X1 [Polyodon spathula]